MTVKDQDFNWVAARQKCSIGVEFLKLRCQAKKNFEERQASLNPRKQRLVFQSEENFGFAVVKHGIEPSVSMVRFILEQERIIVDKELAGPLFTLTLTLSDDGECRYKD